jgi:hypothetical protein
MVPVPIFRRRSRLRHLWLNDLYKQRWGRASDCAADSPICLDTAIWETDPQKSLAPYRECREEKSRAKTEPGSSRGTFDRATLRFVAVRPSYPGV